jgi:Domain of unknown function (DUF4169)
MSGTPRDKFKLNGKPVSLIAPKPSRRNAANSRRDNSVDMRSSDNGRRKIERAAVCFCHRLQGAMTAEIINLRRARKATIRAAEERKAAANRALFGASKQEKQGEKARREREECTLDAHRRSPEMPEKET